MNIIGVSGIEGTMEFKRRHWPDLDERDYRISQGHDSAAALVVDGEFVVGVAEERISRRKHTGDFPVGAIGACLAHAGLRLDEIDEIVHSFDYRPYRNIYAFDPVTDELYRDVLCREAFVSRVRNALPGFPVEKIEHVDHHLAHAASAYLTSGFEDCLTIVIDGMGEAHGATVYCASDGRLDPVHRIFATDSIGIFYSVLTLHLGFDFNSDEYKIMGLAPYGDPERFRSFFDEAVVLTPDGGWEIAPLTLGGARGERENYLPTRRHFAERLIAPREPDAEIASEHRDVAAALQSCLDRAILHVCSHFGERLGLRRLTLAGGVALNTTANGKLLACGAFDEIYVQPAAADDGSALGAALHRASCAARVPNRRSPVPFYGPVHPFESIERALSEFGARIEVTRLASTEDACEAAADLIAAGEVVAWYRGRMEFGPRALGHRSILADPGRPEMRDRVNALVKMREAFRPFAPAVSLEEVHRWFEVAPGTELPYMTVNVDVRSEHRADLPAITHVDGSARVQTVSAKDNLEFHKLLAAVGRRTGREMVLNTSFNVKGQAIVNTPTEAVETFLATGIQALFLGDALVRKR
ncbi:MAG TPA: carbamoyltransferase C-terminal domain-containing protein [Solirubrobacteraceae bacterium]|jgi:carbamoyltransferase|nr:carbamoyltransferase C-terminal domain-containing protein [Solirubrobacteraceae bacterium]